MLSTAACVAFTVVCIQLAVALVTSSTTYLYTPFLAFTAKKPISDITFNCSVITEIYIFDWICKNHP